MVDGGVCDVPRPGPTQQTSQKDVTALPQVDILHRLQAVYALPGLTLTQKAVLAYIAWRDGNGGSKASQSRMAEELGANRRTVMRALAVLYAKGWISKQMQGPREPIIYRLSPRLYQFRCDTESQPPVTQSHNTGDTESHKQEVNKKIEQETAKDHRNLTTAPYSRSLRAVRNNP